MTYIVAASSTSDAPSPRWAGRCCWPRPLTETTDNYGGRRRLQGQDAPAHFVLAGRQRGLHAPDQLRVSYDTDDERMRSVARPELRQSDRVELQAAGLNNRDSTAVVFDMSNLFNGSDNSTSPIQEGGFPILPVRARPTSPPWIFYDVKSFEDNVAVKTSMTHHNVSAETPKLGGTLFLRQTRDAQVTRTLMLRPRSR